MNVLRGVIVSLSLLIAPVLLIKANAEEFPQLVPLPPLTDSFVTTTRPTVGEALSDWSQSGEILASNPNGQGLWGDTYFKSFIAPVAGAVYQEGGLTYSIYPTSKQGIGYVLQVNSNGDTGNQGFKNITGIDDVHLYKGGPHAPIFYTYRIKYVTTGEFVSPGQSIIGGDVIGQSHLKSTFNNTYSPVSFSTVSVDISNKGCLFGSQNISIPLEPAPYNQFKGIGTVLSTTNAITINLDCDAGTSVSGVLSDVINPSNVSEVLTTMNTLNPGEDMGVGIRFLYSTSTGNLSTTPITFGPDASWSGAYGQFPIKSPTDPDNVTLTLIPQYYQNNPSVEVGAFTAKATLTLAYE
ncbi:hypothetical protein HB976_11680 [Yersinia mollaretii]|uniref:F17f-G fimbrial adhesin n=1 Tax=Yersinia mollaretii TaxID=33060 RepID=A0AA36LT88_YERMO|nr:fimbrial protein [Yersinia mollaretii]MDA5535507.1 hypothetical protein [Yersinia mollaretii]NIL03612.1 hypothetical protein [Yersinia mollaretii]CND98266.1 F17f-G fimbrial adhesin precursor [Yersinia mollaretii]CNI49974.1 F17f-G fimbrial adhesin precursor [Yersinia mollaretii]CQJ21734.1 F17f-G fimbrial adhesin precursor [Yersinia mollaretii]